MAIFRGSSLVTVVCLGLVFLTACSAKEESEVSLILPGPMTSKVQSNPTAGDGSSLNITPTGLISNRACYFIHVTAPDLIVPGTSGGGGGGGAGSSCAVPVPGLGKIFGPYKYGADAVIKVPSGPGRMFDLIGFVNPYSNDPDCLRPWRVQLLTKPNGQQEPKFFYGDYVIDEDDTPPTTYLAPEGPDGKLFAFARSAPTNLTPGIVKVPLNRIEWTDEQPTRYACGGGGGGGGEYNAIFPPMHDGVIKTGMDSELFLDIRCPSGASEVSLRVSGVNDHFYPPQTCVSGRAMFGQIKIISDMSDKKPATDVGCWFDDKDGIDEAGERSPCLVFDATPGSTFAGTPFISGRVQFQSMYRNVMHTPSPPTAPQALAINIDPAKVKLAGYEKKSGSIREVYVASGPGHYNDLRTIVLKPQEILGTGYRTSSFEWNGNTSTLASNQLPSSPPNMHDITLGKIGSSISSVGALFFTNYSSGNYFGAVKFGATQGYPTFPLPDYQGEFESGDRIVSENGLQVASSRTQKNTFVPTLPLTGSTFTVANHDLVDGQIVRLDEAIADTECGASTASSSGAPLKVFEVSGPTFKLKTLGGFTLTNNSSCAPHFTARSFYAMRTTSNDHQTNLPINGGSHRTIPMFPGHNGSSYDTVSKILLDAPTTGKTTVVSLDFEATQGSALITKCDQVGAAAGCTYPSSYRIPSLGSIEDADILVGNGDPILLAVNGNGVLRYSLGESAGTAQSSVLHPTPSDTIVSARIRSLRLRDQAINRSNEALLYIEHGSVKAVYRTRDAGANWYRVHTIPTVNSILDIIPAHAHTKNDEGPDHWEPSFLLLEKSSTHLRVIGQDWHGF